MSSDVIWCHLMSSDFIWCHLMSFDVIWCHLLSYDVIWCHLMSFGVRWCHPLSSDVLWCHLVSVDVIFSHRMSSVVIWCDLLSSYVILCHLMSSHKSSKILLFWNFFMNISPSLKIKPCIDFNKRPHSCTTHTQPLLVLLWTHHNGGFFSPSCHLLYAQLLFFSVFQVFANVVSSVVRWKKLALELARHCHQWLWWY